MTFQDSISSVLTQFATFTGRASRPEFWWFMLFCFLVSLVSSVIDAALFGVEIVTTILGLALLVPQLAVGARRLHDLDKSGWWQLLILVPVIGWIVLIYFFVQPGQASVNRFGAPPSA